MHWADAHVNPMLALRTAGCNDRWVEVGTLIEGEQRRQVAVRRQQRQQRRQVTAKPSSVQAAAEDTIVGSWRRNTLSRASFQRSATSSQPSLAQGVEGATTARAGQCRLICKTMCHTPGGRRSRPYPRYSAGECYRGRPQSGYTGLKLPSGCAMARSGGHPIARPRANSAGSSQHFIAILSVA